MILKGVSILTFQLNISEHTVFITSINSIEILTNNYVYQVLTL